jgi:hypothetical protein
MDLRPNGKFQYTVSRVVAKLTCATIARREMKCFLYTCSSRLSGFRLAVGLKSGYCVGLSGLSSQRL